MACCRSIDIAVPLDHAQPVAELEFAPVPPVAGQGTILVSR